ncbi:GAF domain-containing protein [Jiangella ureilytica]|uniref:GAF domain-containing protein n=1 Tax=Jiangella ureilytica TaxID=2530374 RepID=A0A4R4RY26_9ACTN|nr:GAF domain-containing protein [Jiangella ureilytica]TDC53563.1 GAF domain-containing protein [Jiangella ureilytica]
MEPLVYRAPMRSRRPEVPDGAGVERALAAGVCGLGGELPPSSPPGSAEEAASAVDGAYGERAARRLLRFAAVPDGAFAWTRDVDGAYLLGRLDGPYRYDASGPARAADLVHVRPCRWLPAPVDVARVPAAVVAAFGRGGRNFQRIRADDAGAQTASLWS